MAPEYDQGNCDNDMPIFRYAEILLNYAEAKAEKANLTQEDLDRSINLLRDRMELPHLDLVSDNANPHPYLVGQYTNVSGNNEGVVIDKRVPWNVFSGVGTYDIDRDGNVDLEIYEGDRPTSVA